MSAPCRLSRLLNFRLELLDLSTAFDTVIQNILLHLSKSWVGIKDLALSLLNSYIQQKLFHLAVYLYLLNGSSDLWHSANFRSWPTSILYLHATLGQLIKNLMYIIIYFIIITLITLSCTRYQIKLTYLTPFLSDEKPGWLKVPLNQVRIRLEVILFGPG